MESSEREYFIRMIADPYKNRSTRFSCIGPSLYIYTVSGPSLSIHHTCSRWCRNVEHRCWTLNAWIERLKYSWAWNWNGGTSDIISIQVYNGQLIMYVSNAGEWGLCSNIRKKAGMKHAIATHATPLKPCTHTNEHTQATNTNAIKPHNNAFNPQMQTRPSHENKPTQASTSDVSKWKTFIWQLLLLQTGQTMLSFFPMAKTVFFLAKGIMAKCHLNTPLHSTNTHSSHTCKHTPVTHANTLKSHMQTHSSHTCMQTHSSHTCKHTQATHANTPQPHMRTHPSHTFIVFDDSKFSNK